jgi:hypothetical protein
MQDDKILDNEYHQANVDMVAYRLERFSDEELYLMYKYLHANGEPTIEGLAEYAKTEKK